MQHSITRLALRLRGQMHRDMFAIRMASDFAQWIQFRYRLCSSHFRYLVVFPDASVPVCWQVSEHAYGTIVAR
jgi:hypothetical protein